MFDLVLRRAVVVDGSGNEPFVSDLAVRDGLIISVGSDLGAGEMEMSMDGVFLLPGFVDIHGHSELRALVAPEMSPKLLQGYTTELAGNCGIGVAPVAPDMEAGLASEVSGILGRGPERWEWSTFPEFLDYLDGRRLGVDMAMLISHGPLRRYVMGDEARGAATDREIDRMAGLVAEAMEAGAFGLSTGLFYDPCCYADARELERLFSSVANRGGLVSVHQRSEGDGILDSLEEILVLAERTGVKLQISHLKIGGKRNYGRLGRVFDRLRVALDRGADVAFDQYPYSAGSTSLYSLLPPRWMGLGFSVIKRLLDSAENRSCIRKEMEKPKGWDGIYSLVGWDGIVLTGAEKENNLAFLGKTMAEIGQLRGQDPFDSFFDLISEEGKALTMIDFITGDEPLERIMVHPLQMFGTDGLYSGSPHPRTFGSSFRVLDRYVGKKGLLSLPEAVSRLSTKPAERIGLDDRGRIEVGRRADLVAFMPQNLRDRADYSSPDLIGEGLPFVWVGGRLAAERGRVVELAGGLIRKG